MTLAATLLALAPIATSAPLDVLEVDSSAGPYFSIQDAVAAATDGDLIRVAPGAYGSVVIDGFEVTIVPTDPAQTFQVTGTVRIRNVGTGKQVALSGARVDPGTDSADTALSVANATGAVRIQDCVVDAHGTASAIWVLDSSDVAITNTSAHIDQDFFEPSALAVIRVTDSGVALHQVDAASSQVPNYGYRGPAGLRVEDGSIVHLLNGSYAGGLGGLGLEFGPCFSASSCIVFPGDGGPGIEALGGSLVDLTSPVLSGGQATWACSCGLSAEGELVEVDTTSMRVDRPDSTVGLTLPSSQPIGTALPYTVTAEPTDGVILTASPRAERSLGAGGVFLVSLAAGQIRRVASGQGTLMGSVPVPSSPVLIGMTWSFQAVHLRPNGTDFGAARTVAFY